jgi:MFS transporter, UMF1 family
VAIGGAYLFARISELYTNRISLMIMVFIWIGVCGYAYMLQSENEFYLLAFVVGLVMGGIQSLSRSTYSKLIPENTVDTASYFSFYDVADKLSVVIGTGMYGLIEHLTGSMRNSALALAFLFFAGLVLLYRFQMPAKNK